MTVTENLDMGAYTRKDKAAHRARTTSASSASSRG